MRNKNSNIQGGSLNVAKVISMPQGTAIKGRICSQRIISLRQITVMKMDAIEENHCLIQ